MTDLGTLGGRFGDAAAVNKHGVVVGTSWTASNEERAFVWRDGTMANLGVRPGDSFSLGMALNDRAEALGASGRTSGACWIYRSFVWRDG